MADLMVGLEVLVMSSWVHSSLRWALLGVCLSGCTTEGPVGEPSTLGADEPLRQKHAALTQAEQSCSLDPRVWSGLVPFDVCAGAEVFFNETFAGNGRTCGSCHPAGNNFTIDLPFVDTDRKSTRLNSSHVKISYAVFCLKKKSTKSLHNVRLQHQRRT